MSVESFLNVINIILTIYDKESSDASEALQTRGLYFCRDNKITFIHTNTYT